MKIKAEELTRKFQIGNQEVIAVNNVNLEVEEALFTAIIGPSGSGKSTLLNLIGLNDYPTSGKLLFNDRDTSQMSNKERRGIRLSHIGFVFQTFNLLPTLNAVENVELPMSLSGKPTKEQEARAVKLLEAVGLRHRLLHRPKELSMGEMQRVAISRALANDPEIIIADEPTGELDSKTGKEIISLLFELGRKGKRTVFVATHDDKVIDAADKVYVISDGKLNLKKG